MNEPVSLKPETIVVTREVWLARRWYSSARSDFNFDFQVSFGPAQPERGEYNYRYAEHPSEEEPGLSVFALDEAGAIHHTHSAYARGLESIPVGYRLLELVPKGRDEDAHFPMSWIRRHDSYHLAADAGHQHKH